MLWCWAKFEVLMLGSLFPRNLCKLVGSWCVESISLSLTRSVRSLFVLRLPNSTTHSCQTCFDSSHTTHSLTQHISTAYIHVWEQKKVNINTVTRLFLDSFSVFHVCMTHNIKRRSECVESVEWVSSRKTYIQSKRLVEFAESRRKKNHSNQ